MADRVSASITIGGTLPRSLLPEFAALVEAEGLYTEGDGEPFTLAMLRENAPLELMAHDLAWGRIETLESWYVAQGLPCARWSGAYSGQWGDERPILAGRVHRRGRGAVLCRRRGRLSPHRPLHR